MISWALSFNVLLKRLGQVLRQWNSSSAEEKSHAHWLWMLYLETWGILSPVRENSPKFSWGWKKFCSEKFRLHSGLPKRIEMGLIAVYFHRRKNPKGFCCKWNTSRKHHQLWVTVRQLRRNSRHYFWWYVWITIRTSIKKSDRFVLQLQIVMLS